MIDIIKAWTVRYFSEPEAVVLVVLLLVFSAILYFLGEIFTPILASVILAYLLMGPVHYFERYKMPRNTAIFFVYSAFLGFFLWIFLFLMPLLWQQLGTLINELPRMFDEAQKLLYILPEKFPDYVSRTHIDNIKDSWVQTGSFENLANKLVSAILNSVPGMISFVVYLFIVPMMIFFMLKDDVIITEWFLRFLPKKKVAMAKVWKDVDAQIGNYIRGKFLEVFIVGMVTYGCFFILNLKYAILLSIIVGLSVIIPVVGAVAATFPVVMVAFFQWGFSSEFAWVIAVYGIITAVDANVLVPLLFSEAVNLHPLAILTSILVFGGLWGFWGVFFAIPLATLVSALLTAWPVKT